MGSWIAVMQNRHDGKPADYTSCTQTKNDAEQIFVFHSADGTENGKKGNKGKNNR